MVPKLPEHAPKLPDLLDFGLQLGVPGEAREPGFWRVFCSWCRLGAKMATWSIFDRFLIDF